MCHGGSAPKRRIVIVWLKLLHFLSSLSLVHFMVKISTVRYHVASDISPSTSSTGMSSGGTPALVRECLKSHWLIPPISPVNLHLHSHFFASKPAPLCVKISHRRRVVFVFRANTLIGRGCWWAPDVYVPTGSNWLGGCVSMPTCWVSCDSGGMCFWSFV